MNLQEAVGMLKAAAHSCALFADSASVGDVYRLLTELWDYQKTFHDRHGHYDKSNRSAAQCVIDLVNEFWRYKVCYDFQNFFFKILF